MSIHEASILIGVSSATLRRWSDAGDIRAFTTPGGHRRFSRAAVASLLPADTIERPDDAMERPADATERPVGNRRRELSRVVREVPWFADLDPAAQRAMRRHARRISTALIASMEAVAADDRASSLGEAESSAAACAVLAAGSGVGLRETVEAFLGFRASYLRALIDASPERRGGARASAASIEAATGAFDRLVCRAMRAHEAVSADPQAARSRRRNAQRASSQPPTATAR
jgi:DNA binding domain, excisionase family